MTSKEFPDKCEIWKLARLSNELVSLVYCTLMFLTMEYGFEVSYVHDVLMGIDEYKTSSREFPGISTLPEVIKIAHAAVVHDADNDQIYVVDITRCDVIKAKELSHIAGAHYRDYRDGSEFEQLAILLETFHALTVKHGNDAQDLHREYMKIDAYAKFYRGLL